MQLISGNGRPKRRDTLLSSIRAFCASHPGSEPEAILQALVQRGLVTVSAQAHTLYALEDERQAG